MPRALALGLGASLVLGALPASAVPVAVSVEMVGEAAAPPAAAVQLHLEPHAPAATGQPPAAIDASVPAPGRRSFDLAGGIAWSVHAELAGFWAEDQLVVAGEGAVAVRLFPTGRIQARVAAPADARMPEELAVRFTAAPPAERPHTVSCALRQGSLDCPVPAGALDLRLQAPGLVPIYRWGVVVKAGRVAQLGDLALRRGASVSGTVEMAQPGEALPRGSQVALIRQSLGLPEREIERGRLRSLRLEARVNERGFFQFEGVPPGSYVLTATAEGYAPARRAPILVREGLESELIDALRLARPLRFALEITPPLDPNGEPWQVELVARRAPEELVGDGQRGAATRDGRWSRAGLAPGAYHLTVLGDQRSRWAVQEVDLAPGQPPLRIEIPLVEIEGRATLGGEPLRATLWFGGRTGRRLRFDSDEKGRFQGILPKEGSWPVQLTADAQQLRVSLEPVEVKRLPGQARARVEVKVPDTRLGGSVVDDSGKAVADAEVTVFDVEVATVRSDDKGEFELRGLRPGPTAVQAESGERSSETLAVEIEERRETPRVQLVLKEKVEVRGHVMSPQGPVPGAGLYAWPALDQVGAGFIERAITGPDGAFSMKVPAGVPALSLLLLPPGYALRLLATPIERDRPLELQVDAAAGTLVLELPAWFKPVAGPAGGPAPLLLHGGTFMPVSSLIRWARPGPAQSAGRFVLAGVEPGRYSLCLGGVPLVRRSAGEAPPGVPCASTVVGPLGEATLAAPMLPSGPGGM
jgi:hypothetical protein